MAAGEGDDRAVDAARAGKGSEVLEQLRTQVPVTEGDGGLGQFPDEHGPQVGAVRPPGAEVDDGGDMVAGGLDVTGPDGEPGGDGVGMDRRPRPVVDGLGREGPQLVGSAAGSHQLQALGHADVAGVRFADAIAEHGRLLDALFRFVEPAAQHGEARASGLGHVAVERLAQAVEDGQAAVEGRLEGGRAVLEQGVGQEQQALGVALVVAGVQGDGDDLPGDVGAFGLGARRPEHVMAGEEAGRQRGRVAGPPAQVEGPFAEGPGPGPLFGHRMLEFAGQRGGELRLPRQVGPGHDGEGPVEFPHDVVPAGGEAGSELGGGQRHPRGRLRVLHPVGDVAGDPQQTPGVEGASGP